MTVTNLNGDPIQQCVDHTAANPQCVNLDAAYNYQLDNFDVQFDPDLSQSSWITFYTDPNCPAAGYTVSELD